MSVLVSLWWGYCHEGSVRFWEPPLIADLLAEFLLHGLFQVILGIFVQFELFLGQ